MGNEGRDGGMKEGREEKKDERCREGVKKKEFLYIYININLKPQKKSDPVEGKEAEAAFLILSDACLVNKSARDEEGWKGKMERRMSGR